MSFILIEDMKFPVVSNGFKSTLHKDMWSTHTTYKLKISVDNNQYDKLKSLYKNSLFGLNYQRNGWFENKKGEIEYSIKLKKYHTGVFDILAMQELSKSKKGKTIQLEICNLSLEDASIEVSRNLALIELLD